MGRTIAGVAGWIILFSATAIADGPRSVALRVVDREGRPVAGASIVGTVQAWQGNETTGSATTDARGEATVAVPADPSLRSYFRVNVWKDGYVPVGVEWGRGRAFEFEGVPASHEVVLDRGVAIGGVVRDEKGRPVVGARVDPALEVESTDPKAIESIGLPPGTTFATDDQGRWRASVLPSWFVGDRLGIKVSHPRFQTLLRYRDRGVPIGELRAMSSVVVLRPGFTVVGTVVDERGQPVAGASVVGSDMFVPFPAGVPGGGMVMLPGPIPAGALDLARWPGVSRATTGPDGRFRFEGRPSGRWLVRAEAPGRAPASCCVRLGRPEDDETLPFPMLQPPAILGVKPAPIPAVEPPKIGATQLDPGGTAEPPLVLRLDPGREVMGRVVDAKGRPVAGAFVAFEGPWPTDLPAVKAGADGRFRLANVPREATTLLAIDPSDSRTARAAIGAGEVVVRLPDVFRLSGRILDDETGRPIERARLIRGSGIADFPGVPDVERPDRPARRLWGDGPAEAVVGGRYEVGFRNPTVPGPGEASLVVQVEAEGYAPAVSREYSREEGEQTHDFRLRKHPWITGTVRAPDGSPAEGAEVAIAAKGGPWPKVDNGRIRYDWTGEVVRSGPGGRYGFPRPKAGGRILFLSDRGMAQRTVDELASEPVVTLEPWGRIRGEVRVGTGPGARRMVAAVVADRDDRGEPFATFFARAMSDGEGRFAMDRVAPGNAMVYRPSWQADETERSSDRRFVAVGAGQTAGVVLGGVGRPVVGRVIRAGGLPAFDLARVDGRLLALQPDPEFPEGFGDWERARRDGWWFAFYRTEEGRRWYERSASYAVNVGHDGRFRLDGVPEGRYRLVLAAVDRPNALTAGPDAETKRLGGRVVVVQVPAGPADEPSDLGTIELQAPAGDR